MYLLLSYCINNLTYKRKTPWINLSHVLMVDLLVKARNGEKCRSEKKERGAKGGASQEKEWGTRKVPAGGRKKLEGGGKPGQSSQLT